MADVLHRSQINATDVSQESAKKKKMGLFFKVAVSSEFPYNLPYSHVSTFAFITQI